jgi:integrase
MPNTWTAANIHFLTQPELRAFFRVITRKRDRALFLIAYRHGLRASEVGLLRVDDLNFAQQRLTIHRVKRSLPGIYPLRADEGHGPQGLPPRAEESFSCALSRATGHPDCPLAARYSHETLWQGGRNPYIKAAFPRPQAFPIATHLLDAGADLRFVQDWVGHASIKNTVIYAQLTSRRRDEEARKVFMSPYVV